MKRKYIDQKWSASHERKRTVFNRFLGGISDLQEIASHTGFCKSHSAQVAQSGFLFP